MARISRSQEELKEASNHLYYEIWMFQTLSQAMALGIAGEGPINNSLLESFTIHVRALIGFFYSENPRNDDIIAEDFFKNENDWHNIRPIKTEILDKAKRRADKEVAHLIYNRLEVTPEKKHWEFIKIFDDLQALVNIFIENVPIDSLGSNWEITKNRKNAQE